MTDHHNPDQQPTTAPNGQAAKGKRQLTPLDAVSMSAKQEAEHSDARPVAHYQHTSKGLFYVGVSVDKKTGAATQAAPQWLANDIELFGCAQDRDGDHYRLLRFKACGNGKPVELAFPRQFIDTNQGWALLRRNGLRLSSAPWTKLRLNDYLDSDEEGSQKMHTIITKAGWHDDAYVLPGGAMIGEPDKPLFYNGERHLADAYATSNKSHEHPHGEPSSWREEVASLARGNSRFMLAIGCGFAAPLLHLLGMESGGVHLYGSSTDGKTTAARVGASVWGKPDDQVMSWSATAYALPNEAATRNDGLLILDEAGQAAQGVIAKATYDLFNGKGKLQGTKDGGNRRANTWRVMVLSTGEKPIDVLVSEGGQRLNAGQEIRLPSIPSDAGRFMGAIEQLHHHPSPEAFATAITKAAKSHYGSAGRAFLTHVQAIGRDALITRLEAAIRAWCADLEQSTGQAKRVARRFALIGEAMELATEFGLTGWATGEGSTAARRCFDEWMRRNGQTKHEDARIIEQAEAFFAAYGLARFHRIRAGGLFEPSHGPSAAGYLRQKGQDEEYLVYPHVFENEIAKGFDRAKVVAVLKAAGMLKTPDDGRPCKGIRVPSDINPKETKPRRLYQFVSATLPANEGEQGGPSEQAPDTEQQPAPAAPSCAKALPTPEDAHGGQQTKSPGASAVNTTTEGPPVKTHRPGSGGDSSGAITDYQAGIPPDPHTPTSRRQAGNTISQEQEPTP
ncbi:hypothetical protein CF126_03975 [Aeromonas dhakensis]|uniref:DUF927 domain-containing protein n=1 Tax=Aeromonas dhakensis TaxID=196024 RepID=UPI0011195E87|nr:DUF927 domain-containing protein [Aeromonas dhakensis]TNI58717.1 hypothetical protein CF126_03975 [Aeromonas dhakensis]